MKLATIFLLTLSSLSLAQQQEKETATLININKISAWYSSNGEQEPNSIDTVAIHQVERGIK